MKSEEEIRARISKVEEELKTCVSPYDDMGAIFESELEALKWVLGEGEESNG